MTAFKPDSAVYASFEGPATVDAMLELAEAKGVVIPLEDLLCTHPYAGLGEHLRKGTYAGLHYTAGDWYHHLLRRPTQWTCSCGWARATRRSCARW